MAAVLVDVSDLGAGQTRAVDADGASLLVCNADGRFYAIANRCPHALARFDGATLAGCILECPVHGGRVDVRDGSPRGRPIRRPVPVYAVRAGDGVPDGSIEIEIPEP